MFSYAYVRHVCVVLCNEYAHVSCSVLSMSEASCAFCVRVSLACYVPLLQPFMWLMCRGVKIQACTLECAFPAICQRVGRKPCCLGYRRECSTCKYLLLACEFARSCL